MASIKKVKTGAHFVTYNDGDREVTKTFGTATEAKTFAKTVPNGRADQEQGHGPVRWEVCYRNAENKGRSKRFPRQAEAAKFARTVEMQKDQGTFADAAAGKVLFREYAETWLAGRSLAANSRKRKNDHLVNHAGPVIGDKQMRQIKAEDIITLLQSITHLSETTRLGIYTDVRAVFAFAKDNRRISEDPFTLHSVRSAKPRPRRRKIVPWDAPRVRAMHDALSERYAVTVMLGSGLGLRQAEAFGFSPLDVDRERRVAVIRRQVLLLDDGLHFGPPKGGREREVPVPQGLLNYLDQYLGNFPPVDVSLPWSDPRSRSATSDGAIVSVPLLLTTRERNALNKNTFNRNTWKPALAQLGIESTRRNGTHALRHYYASVLLDAGESIKALSEYLGHHSTAYTLDTYTHLMPDSHARSTAALDAALGNTLAPQLDEKDNRSDAA
ncbi:site-specific integrase [Nocardioides sp. NPDC092400]|uniref:tyrosine-type recombinase/integrase n=1 Tax=Nocardioides sp. NPDC092400 TaxID=3155196 RepID=UPI00343C7508